MLGLDSGLGQTLRGAQGSTALWPPKESDPSRGHSPCPAHRLSPAFPSCSLSPRGLRATPGGHPGSPPHRIREHVAQSSPSEASAGSH